MEFVLMFFIVEVSLFVVCWVWIFLSFFCDFYLWCLIFRVCNLLSVLWPLRTFFWKAGVGCGLQLTNQLSPFYVFDDYQSQVPSRYVIIYFCFLSPGNSNCRQGMFEGLFFIYLTLSLMINKVNQSLAMISISLPWYLSVISPWNHLFTMV